MDVFTTGRINHQGYNLQLKYIPEEKFLSDINACKCYKLIFIEKGSGIAYINQVKCILTAPVLLCLKDTEMLTIGSSDSISARSLYFHPRIINKSFTCENITEKPSRLTGTDYDDIYWLRVFTNRTSTYIGQLSIGPSAVQRVTSLFDAINLELEEQRDADWPCRSRSFLFELLFILQRILTTTKQEIGAIRSEKFNEIDPVIVYLHTNYQQKITIPDLSKTFNMNRTSLEKKFCEVTGLPIISYLVRLRIELASKFLRDTLLPISEILERVGFNDRTHFNRLFMKYTGYSPSDYRQKFCQML